MSEPRESDLLPCPFCGGEGDRFDIEYGENKGGSCVQCRRCLASSGVEFESKENFIGNWNRRVADQRDDEIATLRANLEEARACLDAARSSCVAWRKDWDDMKARADRAEAALAQAGKVTEEMVEAGCAAIFSQLFSNDVWEARMAASPFDVEVCRSRYRTKMRAALEAALNARKEG